MLIHVYKGIYNFLIHLMTPVVSVAEAAHMLFPVQAPTVGSAGTTL